MGRRIERWIADDGEEFQTEQEMLLYELDLVDQREIDVYLDAMEKLAPRRKVEYRRVLLEWQRYKNAQAVEQVRAATPQETVPAEPAPLPAGMLPDPEMDLVDPGAPINFGESLGNPDDELTEEEQIEKSFRNAQSI